MRFGGQPRWPKGKVIIDGPKDVIDVLLRVLEAFTDSDDSAVMPLYDLTKISK